MSENHFDPLDLILGEVRELKDEIRTLRTDFHASQVAAASDRGERKGRTTILAAFVSAAVAVIVAYVQNWFHK